MSEVNIRISPDYASLARFLVTPFLESPETLSLDSEVFNEGRRVWLRLAFNVEDRGKVYGRGGRNIQSIRSILQTSATLAGQSLSLEVYEPPGGARRSEGDLAKRPSRANRPHPQSSNK
jgi:hypothetical protein